MADYPLIIVPEWDYLSLQFKDELVEYVKGGGSLLLIGPGAAALFQGELDVAMEGRPRPAKDCRLAYDGQTAPIYGQTQSAKLGPKCTAVGRVQMADSSSQPAASVCEFGQGKIAAVYFTFGQGYVDARTDLARRFLNDLARELFPDPMVVVKGSRDVDVVVNRLNGKLMVNLVNTAGPHRTEPILDTIPPVGPLTVTIRHATNPTKVTLEPAGFSLPFEHHDGRIRCTVPHVEIHEIIVVEAP